MCDKVFILFVRVHVFSASKVFVTVFLPIDDEKGGHFIHTYICLRHRYIYGISLTKIGPLFFIKVVGQNFQKKKLKMGARLEIGAKNA